MKIQKTICDCCGHEIQDKHSYIICPQAVDIKSKDILPSQPYGPERDRDYCEDCIQALMKFLHEGF